MVKSPKDLILTTENLFENIQFYFVFAIPPQFSSARPRLKLFGAESKLNCGTSVGKNKLRGNVWSYVHCAEKHWLLFSSEIISFKKLTEKCAWNSE